MSLFLLLSQVFNKYKHINPDLQYINKSQLDAIMKSEHLISHMSLDIDLLCLYYFRKR